MFTDVLDENFTVFGQFFLADPTDLAKCSQRGGLLTCHIT